MKTSLVKAALLVLSMMPITVFASHWGYEGEGSPEHWGALSEEYKTCQSGMNQSPINIDTTFKAHLSPLETPILMAQLRSSTMVTPFRPG